MYSLATARTTRSATHAAASSTAGPPAVGPSPASNPSSTRKKRRAAGSPVDGEAATESTPSKKPRATPKKAAKPASASPVGGSGDEGGATAESKPRTTPKKFAAYLTTPYPDYARPTAEECEEVTRLLGDMHGLPQRPGQVEKLKEDGPVRVGEACGAVPSVCDALIRTILSQNTTNNNSARAYASLLERFGPSKANSRAVSLPAVFRADLADVQDSIRCGGLANVKGKVITGVLKTVYNRNAKLEAAEASVTKEAAAVPEASAQPAVKEESKPAAVKDEPDAGASLAAAALAAPSASTAKRASRSAKEELPSPEIKPKTEAKTGLPAAKTPINTDDDATLDRLLSLDYVHQMADDEAMRELESFPGVGPKTASCVLLFCLERDSFAVDTHVFRLSKALGWVPARATRETTYEHLDVRIPPALKYPLHVLLIAHGKACTRCAANGKTSRPSLGPCPLVGLTPGKAMKAKAEPKAEEAEEADDGVEAEAEEGDGEEVGDSLPPAAKAVFDADVDRAIQQAHGGR